ncbi:MULTISPECIES: peptide deformylase [unclassified Stenotrophomonas]|uniref:peptide deformylase n=1 Tax=unclassified Stenotrophomonas TaxID=196198 RepID=UPI0024B53CA4|nr:MULTISPECIES: peptide deformylase [unclassified Stenotrophomonas]MDI9248314.1 peptide deformylase [Stenotrophomonas sp. RS-48]MDI9271804.1 peptide deformylase [Stenotrophomonas sp. PFBMAA-4]
MTFLSLLTESDPRLRKPSHQILRVDDRVRALARDMLATMYRMGACGLAAPQVNARVRLIVMDTSRERNRPWIYLNPELVAVGQRQARFEEGCLSLPGIFVDVYRARRVTLRSTGLDGQLFEQEMVGWDSAVIQHEIDHLDGRLMTDIWVDQQAGQDRHSRKRRHG